MSFTHGTASGYERHGCRCDLCRANHNERVARNRADRLASGPLSHGTRSAYDAGCRCAACMEDRRRAYAELSECARALSKRQTARAS
jgi:hypothetical protein